MSMVVDSLHGGKQRCSQTIVDNFRVDGFTRKLTNGPSCSHMPKELAGPLCYGSRWEASGFVITASDAIH